MKSRLYYSTRLQPQSFEDFGARASHSFMRLQHGDCAHYSMEDIISDVDKSNIPYKQELLDSNSFSIRLCDPLPDSVTKNKLNNFARASKADSVFADKDNEKFGTKLHLELENLDWSNYPTLPKSDFIKNEREKMLNLRQKGQEARKSFTELANTFQASHPEWQLQQTSQWRKDVDRQVYSIRLYF